MFDIIQRNIARHIDLTKEEFDYFTSLIQVKRLRKKQFLLEEGEICRHEGFINSGCLRQYYLDKKGQEHIVQFAISDWWIGDQSSFLTDRPSCYFIDALEDSQVLLIEKPALKDLCMKVPKFERFFPHRFSKQLCSAAKQDTGNPESDRQRTLSSLS